MINGFGTLLFVYILQSDFFFGLGINLCTLPSPGNCWMQYRGAWTSAEGLTKLVSQLILQSRQLYSLLSLRLISSFQSG
ncbi:uncharacterized protein EV420DRAFT_1494529 [Desarmillaria tabescens]|uniref:Uncharacterized protein n=1 Tax=Armillaria tabescens TaxID=1929756 RepID=A0AA39U2N9_ARMTA|nr:uncharacterized protein EV420DRAFT_1494529 [Desarmillaria tabescens]KAK0469439.1 hypothetical protein EV420DRAFT_1494529 [Desarmillaria tabescens]